MIPFPGTKNAYYELKKPQYAYVRSFDFSEDGYELTFIKLPDHYITGKVICKAENENFSNQFFRDCMGAGMRPPRAMNFSELLSL